MRNESQRPLLLKESRCPLCSTLLTKMFISVDKGTLSEEQFNEFKKGARVMVGVETRCRKCKRTVENTTEATA